jgi:hypothetical protein
MPVSFGSYDELQSAIADYLARDDLTSEITGFIKLCETKLQRLLRTRYQEVRATAVTADDDGNLTPYVALPSDFAAMRRLNITSSYVSTLDYVTSVQLSTMYTGQVSGRPHIYTLIGTDIQFAPNPDAAYDLELVYYQMITPLSDDNPSNWVLENFPDIYLYGSLLEAQPFIRDDQRISTWGSFFRAAIEDTKQDDREARWNGAPLRQRSSVGSF